MRFRPKVILPSAVVFAFCLALGSSVLAQNRAFLSTNLEFSEATYLIQFTANVSGTVDKFHLTFPAGILDDQASLRSLLIGDKQARGPIVTDIDPRAPDTLVIDVPKTVSIKSGAQIQMEIMGLKNPEAGDYQIEVALHGKNDAVLGFISPLVLSISSAIASVDLGSTPSPEKANKAAGDITAVIAGTGLSGGATSGNATLNVNTAQIQARVTGTCAAGNAMRVVGADGGVTCEPVSGATGGTLSADIVNATTQYNIGGNRLVSMAGANNLFVGLGSGQANTSGQRNSFFGGSAGAANNGNFNSFFGNSAGATNTIGGENSLFGSAAGINNTEGGANSFFGSSAGFNNSEGSSNSFFGQQAGFNNTSGSSNTMIGRFADVGSNNLTNATALGTNARVDQSNSLVLGSVAGQNQATASVNVGIGITAPQARLHMKGDMVVETSGSGGNIQLGTPNAETGMTIAKRAANLVDQFSRVDMRFDGFVLKLVAIAGPGIPASTSGMAISTAGNVGIGTTSPVQKLDIEGGLLRLDQLAAGGDQPLCRNSVFHTIATCSSSLRYKEQIAPYKAGLEVINRLRPISFAWKANGTRDLGLGAEDVAKVEPLLVAHNDNGEIEGVRYDHLNVVLINAIKQQQEQIDRQRGEEEKQIDALKAENAELKARLEALEQMVRSKPYITASAEPAK